MGIKNNLQTSMAKYRELKSASEKVIEEIKKSDRYSTEYKNELIRKEKSVFSGKKDEIKNTIKSLFETEKQKLESKRKPIVKDQAFELRLNNALKIIELAGKRMSESELKALVEPFKDDYETLNAFSNIFSAQGIGGDGVLPRQIIPRDGLEGKIFQLQDTEKSIYNGLLSDSNMLIDLAVHYLPEDEEEVGE